MKLKPVLFVGGLSRAVFISTDYTRSGSQFIARSKHDITEQFEQIAQELGWTPPEAPS